MTYDWSGERTRRIRIVRVATVVAVLVGVMIGLPTIIQYAKGYGPAARKLAKLVGNVQFVTPLDGITPAEAKGAKLIVILGS